MSTPYQVQTDSPKKITLDSHLVAAKWLGDAVYGGFDAKLEIITTFVSYGSPIKIKCCTEKGKTIANVDAKVTSKSQLIDIPIPEKVSAGELVYCIVKLPRHGLEIDSNRVIACQPIRIHGMKWGTQDVRPGDIMEMLVQFDCDITDFTSVVLTVYEFEKKGRHDILYRQNAIVKARKIGFEMLLSYHPGVKSIPIEAELKPRGLQYQQPKFFFTVTVGEIEFGIDKQQSGFLLFKDTISIKCRNGRDRDKKEDVKYIITLPNGVQETKVPDRNGKIEIKDTAPGRFQIKESGKDLIVNGESGILLEIWYTEIVPLIDAHMHIQSNNCCPLPLQWGLVAEALGVVLGRPDQKDRKNLNDTSSSLFTGLFLGRLGKIGRLPTDLVARLYNQDLHNSDARQEMYWTLFDKKFLDEHKNELATETMRVVAGKKAGLSSLNSASNEELEDEFNKKTAYYFENTKPLRMCIALLMDMTFGHYWGRLGLPVYLSTGNAMMYINDFSSIQIEHFSGSDIHHVSYESAVVTPECCKSSLLNTLGQGGTSNMPDFSQVHLFPSYYEDEIFASNGKCFYSTQYELFNETRGVIPKNETPVIKFQKGTKSYVDNKDVHFVATAPGEDPARFEDYHIQKEYSVSAAIRYPLSLFISYHFDPRRHCLSDTQTPDTLAKSILDKHSFFTATENSENRCVLDNGTVYSGCVEATLHPELNDSGILSQILARNVRKCEDALNDLFLNNQGGDGLFWGVKMYPRLGFSPSDFKRYPQLEMLYKACSDNSIPITAHCGPGGMSISDYFLYERYDERRGLNNTEDKSRYDLKNSAKRFDGVVRGTKGQDSPARWEEVLKGDISQGVKGYQNLKICLAHFGSFDTWKEASGFELADKELAKRVGKFASEYDKYDKYNDWVKKICQLVTTYDNVYTDISYFLNDDPSLLFGVGHDREDVTKDLIYLIKNYPDLKDRLMMGSDWYMIEKDKEKGIGNYFRKMFYMLRDVSKDVGFDAWHQFSVVNPLRFLGLIEEKKGSKGPFKIDVEKLKKYAGKFEKKIKDRNWVKNYKVGKSIQQIMEEYQKTIKDLLLLKIVSGEDVKRDEKLIILQENT